MDIEVKDIHFPLEKMPTDCMVVVLKNLTSEEIKNLRRTSITMYKNIDHAYKSNKIVEPKNIHYGITTRIPENKLLKEKVTKIVNMINYALVPPILFVKTLFFGWSPLTKFLEFMDKSQNLN